MKNSLLAPTTIRLKALCPTCDSKHIIIHTHATIDCRVIFDTEIGEYIVTEETIGDIEWDKQSPVNCPTCDWQGTLADC